MTIFGSANKWQCYIIINKLKDSKKHVKQGK